MRHALCILIVALLGAGQQASAYRLKVNGFVTDHATRKPMATARVRIYKDGVQQQVKWTGSAGRWSAQLDNHASYVLRVDAPHYQTKCILIDTQGLEWEGDRRVSTLDVEMRLPAFQGGTDLSYFDLPLGIAHFEPATGLTSWNMTYEDAVRAKAREIMASYDERRKELGLPVFAGGNAGLGAMLLHHGH